MMKNGIQIIALIVAGLLSACSGCSQEDGGGSGSDTSSDTGATDGDTDADTDADSDSDTEVDPWAWTDLPAGEDCGAGCRQLTFGESVQFMEWDVWGDRVIYTDDTRHTWIVDVATQKHLRIPNIHPEHPDAEYPTSTGTAQPALNEENGFYTWVSGVAEPARAELIRVAIDDYQQDDVLSWSGEVGSGVPVWRCLYPDVSTDGIVCTGACGTEGAYDLCFIPLDDWDNRQLIVEGGFGDDVRIWDDKIVFWDVRNYPDDITGYDLSTSSFVEVTADDESQLNPRMHGNKVVYQDQRLGTSDAYGDWNHAAIWIYDWTSQTHTQLTDGTAIAAYPDVYENIVVWADYRNCSNPHQKNDLANVEIWGMNLNTMAEFQITNLPGRGKTMPRIWGDKVFVAIQFAGTGDGLYMFDLPSGAK